MNVLGIETSGSRGGVALIDGGELVLEECFEKGMVHGREIAPAVERICRQAEIPLREIDLIGVDIGPGSYTGLRVGLTAGKALAYALGCPILGVGAFETLLERAAPHAPEGAVLCPVIDAGWRQIGGHLFRAGKALVPEGDMWVTAPREFVERLPAGAFIFGNALVRHRDVFSGAAVRIAPEDLWFPRPSVVASIAARRFEQGERADLYSLSPIYLRPTEAEMKLSP